MAEITWNGDDIVAQLRDASVEGLTNAAEHLLQVSRTQVPIEEGTLERSGVASVDPQGREAAVSYSTPYAIDQHENMTYRHAEGRAAKFLENPMNEERDTMLDLIAAASRRAIN